MMLFAGEASLRRSPGPICCLMPRASAAGEAGVKQLDKVALALVLSGQRVYLLKEAGSYCLIARQGLL